MNHQINLLHLKYFCDAALNKSISEAAKINFVTQSTVSQAIVKLEITLRTPLLVHSRQKFQLTEQGQSVFEHARTIFKVVQDIHDKITHGTDAITGSLNFVTTHSVGMSYIAPSYLKMKAQYPHIDIRCQLGNLNFIRNALRQGEAEFGVAVYEQNCSLFDKRVLRRGGFHLYQHQDGKVEQIDDGILIDFPSSLYVEDLIDYFVQSNYPPLKIQQALSAWEVVARFTELKIGIGFLPDYLMSNNRYPEIKNYPIKIPHFEYQICAIYNKGERLSRAANAFLDLFQQE